jgi:hypothetical protein
MKEFIRMMLDYTPNELHERPDLIHAAIAIF